MNQYSSIELNAKTFFSLFTSRLSYKRGTCRRRKRYYIDDVQKVPSSGPRVVRRQLQPSAPSLSLVIENRAISQNPLAYTQIHLVFLKSSMFCGSTFTKYSFMKKREEKAAWEDIAARDFLVQDL